VRVKSCNEAVQLARCAGEDAANRRMRKAGRNAWSETDHAHAHAVRETERVLTDLGFDVTRWAATAGFPRNEPEEPKAKKRFARRSTGRQADTAPTQLSFAFA
jgi:ferric-dicitrate binding protein FerR (iron transport regulator)